MNSQSGPEDSESDALLTEETSTGDVPLTIDEIFEILKNSRRRLVLEHLEKADNPVKLNDLADQVTAIENDTDVSSITSAERKRVYVGLYQFHLPKMADMGVIEYDKDRGDVALTERGEKLYQRHEQEGSSDRPWHLAYLCIAGGGVIAVIVSAITLNPVVGTALLSVQTTLLGAMAIAHARDNH